MSKQKNNNNVLLEIAKEDLKSSILLYENNLYPQSIFYFQQSVEKIIKCIGLKSNVIRKSDLQKDINHKTSLIFIKAIEKFNLDFPELENIDYRELFNNLKSNTNNLSLDILIYTTLNNVIETFKSKDLLPLDLKNIDTIDGLYEVIKKYDPNNTDIKEYTKEEFSNIYSKEIIKVLKEKIEGFLKAVLVLFLINIFSEKLVTIVRYPDMKALKNPSINFNKDNVLVCNLDNLHEIITYCIEILESFYLEN